MAMFRVLGAALLALCACGAHASAGPIVVTGATGRTGALIYGLLKDEEANVRALGAAALVIVTSASPICNPFPKCHFPAGAEPVEVDWKGAKNQLAAFASDAASKQSLATSSVVLISTMGTTEPDNSLDAFGHISFYKLNFEATLMASGLPFTIIKPCGLTNDAGRARELIVGHDDEMSVKPPLVPRADVARVAVAALQRPDLAARLRFDLCSKDSSTPTSDAELPTVLEQAHYHWSEGRVPAADSETITVV